jgi:hypothetical protein
LSSGGSTSGGTPSSGGASNSGDTSGSATGYVDGSTCTGPGTDNTPTPPYTWR